TSRSASSNGSTGRTSQASAPDQRASHASCLRSSTITIGPRYGSTAPRRSRASEKPPALEAISSATTASGRSRNPIPAPCSPSCASRNDTRSPSRRSMLPIEMRSRSRASASGDTSRTFTHRILSTAVAPLSPPPSTAIVARVGQRTRGGGRGEHGQGGGGGGGGDVRADLHRRGRRDRGEPRARPDRRGARPWSGARHHGLDHGPHLGGSGEPRG